MWDTYISYFIFVKHEALCIFHITYIIIDNPCDKVKSWIIDTSAIDHMISTMSLFTFINAVISSRVKLPNENYATVTHIGTVQLFEHPILHNVLCVSSFSFNLIYVRKLIKTLNCYLIFLENSCFIQFFARRTIGVGRLQGGLFYLMHKPILHSAKAFSLSIKNASINIWHYKLGHLSRSRMKMLDNFIPYIYSM